MPSANGGPFHDDPHFEPEPEELDQWLAEYDAADRHAATIVRGRRN